MRSPSLADPSPAPAAGAPFDPAGSSRSSARANDLAATIPGVLGAIAEGAWVAVLGAAFVAAIGGPGPAGTLLPCVLAALLGYAAARLLPVGGGRAIALTVVAAAVVVGAFAAGSSLGLAGASETQPMGLYVVLGLAVLRGAPHGDPTAGSHVIDTLVRRSPLLLGGAWLVGLVMAGEGRPAFAASAAFDSLVFVVVAALALGTSRLAALPPEVRGQLGGNGPWLAMVALVVGLALVIALPLAAVMGQPIGTVAAAVTAGVTTGLLATAGAIVTAIMVVVDAAAGLLTGALGMSQIQAPNQPPPEVLPQQPLPPSTAGSGDTGIVELLIAITVVVVLVVVAWLLARRARRSRVGGRVTGDTRSIDMGERPGLPGLRMPRRLRALLAPNDATAAYQRLLTDWADAPDLARDPAETPAAHAARLRVTGEGATGLDLLAADYQLARFAGVRLTPAEDRRAITRWRRLRGRAKGRSGSKGAAGG